MKRLLFICFVLTGCAKEEVASCCKTAISVDYTVRQSGMYLGGKFWTATFLDCESNVTQEALNQYPTNTPPIAVGYQICD